MTPKRSALWAGPALLPGLVVLLAAPWCLAAENQGQPLRVGEEAVLAALDEPAELDVTDEPLKHVCAALQKRHRIPIHLDWRALEDVGVSGDTPITFSMSGLPLRNLLDLMLANLELKWTVTSGVLLITTPEQLDTPAYLVTRVYDVSDLLAFDLLAIPDRHGYRSGLPTTQAAAEPSAPQGMDADFGVGSFNMDEQPDRGSPIGSPYPANGSYWPSGQTGFPPPWWIGSASPITLPELIEVSVSPDSWDTVGGPAHCAPFGPLLVVTQTVEAHEEIQRLLDAIRKRLTDAPIVLLDVRWLGLSNEQLEELAAMETPSAEGANGFVVDREALNRLADSSLLYRGRLAAMSGQQVYMTAGQRRSVVLGAVPVVGAGVGYQPQVDVANVGIVLEIRPWLVQETETVVLDVQSTVTGWDEGQPALRMASSTPVQSQVDEATGKIVREPGRESSLEVDRVVMPTHQLATTLRVPLGQPVLVGGLTLKPSERSDRSRRPRQLYLVIETRRVAR